MEIKSILQQALSDRYKAESVIRRIRKEAIDSAKDEVRKKYKNSTIVSCGLELEFLGVRTSYWLGNAYEIVIPEIYLEVYYIASSKNKLTKRQRDKIKETKELFETRNYAPNCNFKLPLWLHYKYKISFEEAMSGEFLLEIN